ncbi:MAG: 2-oxoacid:acceptor oxidoreductase family protein [Chitinispirillales bacterium]|jgi:2-oxoglutarate ferredoxin oxidoreductase subunit alpha|nr:2-oxoacid:acceptor oxidoreductase family protein [Chitinispirillales bacterium]
MDTDGGKSDAFTLRVIFRGEAGDGILNAGDMLMRSAAALGFSAAVHKSFPPTIRGGACSALVTVSGEELSAPVSSAADFVFLLDKSTLFVHGDGGTYRGADGCANTGSSVNANNGDNANGRIGGIKSFALNFGLCPHINIHPQLKSSFALGVASQILGVPERLILNLITEKLRKKNLTEENEDAFRKGHESAAESIIPAIGASHKHAGRLSPPMPMPGNRVVLDGNTAVALGAISAGCRIYASYPITPATPIGERMAQYLHSFGGFAYQAEDEISAIGVTAGAWYSGVPAMTATSGPGLSLMQEFLGYCSMTETPAVVVDVQRAGPSTGMPTMHSQDDLMAAAFGGHGEDQRIVLAAASIEECFYLTIEAFDMAQRFRCPVILLSDSALGNLRATCRRPDPALGLDGMPKIAAESAFDIAGCGDEPPQPPHPAGPDDARPRRITGLEHDEHCMPSNSAENRVRQQYRRFSKMDKIELDYSHMQTIDADGVTLRTPRSEFAKKFNIGNGDEDNDAGPPADLCVVSWGLSSAMTRFAVAALRKRGLKIACLYPRLLFPFISGHYLKLLEFCPRIAVVESNYTGQLASMIRMYTGINTIPVKKYCGDPFTPEEIEAELYNIIQMENFILDISEHEAGGDGEVPHE